MIKISYIIALLLAVKWPLFAAVYGEWGLGLNDSQSQTKYGEFGYEEQTPYMYDYRFGVGSFLDKSDKPGNKDSVYTHLTVGIQPRIDPLRLAYFIGPALISSPDNRLGSYLQCAHKFIVGFKDFRGASISFVYTHFSNAGLKRPNLGRDFLGIQVQF